MEETILFQNRSTNDATAYRKLSSVGIKTSDVRMALKRVWICESQLQAFQPECPVAKASSDTEELAKDHFCLAA